MLNHLFFPCSVKHAYEGKWTEKTTLTTCNPHAKRVVTSSETPQEVEDKKKVIFTYDVDFQVRGPFLYLHEIRPHIKECILRILLWLNFSNGFFLFLFLNIYASPIVHLAGE